MQDEVSQRVLEARVLETGHRLLTLEQAKRAKQMRVQAPADVFMTVMLRCLCGPIARASYHNTSKFAMFATATGIGSSIG